MAQSNQKPISSADLLNDDPRLPDLNYDIKIPEEINYQNLVNKIGNKAKHLEKQIEQNRNRGKLICQECFNAMKATEVLAFDFLFTEYLIGNKQSKNVYSFVDTCIRPTFNLMSGDPRDIDAAVDHIKNVQKDIQNSVNSILQCDPKSKSYEISKRATEFLQFLRERKQSLENELKRNKEEAKPPKMQQVPTVISVFLNEPNRPVKNETDSNFEKWVLNELKPDVVLVDQKTAETRALFGSCIHRIHAIQDLRDQIAKLKSTSTSTQNLQYIDCDPNSIYNSPFFTAVQENCGFLVTALNGIHNHQQTIPECIASIDSCEKNLKKLEEQCQFTIENIKKYTADMEKNIANNRREIQSLSEKVKPYVDALQFKVSSLSDIQNETDQLDNNFEEYLKSLLEDAKSDTSQIKIQIEILNELRAVRSEIGNLCKESLPIISANIETQKNLFKAIFDYNKAVEYVSIYEKEVKSLEDYEKALRSIIESMHTEEVKLWCQKLTEISDVLVNCVKNQEEIYDQFEPLIKIDQKGDEEIERKKKEVNDIIQENGKLIEEETKLQIQAMDAEEELFGLMQQIEALGGFSDDQLDEKLADCATCPICREKQRNEILISCGHPLCSECIAKAKIDHLCPICQKPFNEDDVKPFFLQ